MQKINGEVVFSASDLVHFMECEHLSALDRLHLDAPMEKAKDSEEAELIQSRGFAHEKAYLEKAKLRQKNTSTLRRWATHGMLKSLRQWLR